MAQKNLLKEKFVEPMSPQIERVPPYLIPENMKLRNTRKETNDARLESNEFWRFENKGWAICEFIHGLYHDASKKLAQHFPIHQILTNEDAKERRTNFEFLTKRLIRGTTHGKIRCGLCHSI